MWNGFKQLDQFSEAVRCHTTLPAKVPMKGRDEFAEWHSVMRAVSQQIDNITS